MLFGCLVSVFARFSLSSLNLFERHTDNGLLNFDGLARALLEGFINFGLLVECTPCLSPSKFDWLDFLMEQTTGLCRDEVILRTVFGNETASTSWHNSELSERAFFGFSYHLERMYLYLIMQF